MVQKKSGFTLIELLVVLAIIAILASITIMGLGDSRSQSNDAKRQADLRLVANAVELFKNKYGHYPSGCNGSTTSHTVTEWSGEEGTGFDCGPGNGNEYIVNLAPEFIPSLPRDPRAGEGDPAGSGYVYTTNNSGTVFKFMALNSVEGERVSSAPTIAGVENRTREFFRCGENFYQGVGTNTTNETWNDAGMCFRSRTAFSGDAASADRVTFSECSTPATYENDYAVSAGFSSDDRSAAVPDKGREYDTEIVRCK